MGPLSDFDHFPLHVHLPADKTPVTASNAANANAEAVTGSNDGAPLVGQTFDGGNPCSNDNPDWAEGTVPCPKATYDGNDVADVFEGITQTPTSAPPPDVLPVVPNEFAWSPSTNEPSASPSGGFAPPSDDTESAEPSEGGAVVVDAVPVPSPSEAPRAVSNDFGDVPDFGAAPVGTISPTKAPTTTSPGEGPQQSLGSSASDVDEEHYVEYPSFYSCDVASQEELVREGGDGGPNAGGGSEDLSLRFDYEIYTAFDVDDVTVVLGAFERQLTNGVASSLGLVDCPDSEAGGAAIELAVRNGPLPWGDRKLMPTGGSRRTLRKGGSSGRNNRLLESTNTLGLSMDPIDEIDTDLADCTSSATLDTPSKCSPIVGVMTVWITNAQQRRLQHLIDTASEEEMLLNTVETYIKQNGSSYLNDELLHVAYIGQRDIASPVDSIVDPAVDSAQKNVNIDPGDEDALSNPLLGLGIFLGVLLVLSLAAAAVVIMRRRRSRNAEEELDMEQGAFPGLTPESAISGSFDTAEDEVTQASVSTLPPDKRSDNLFRLTGVRSDAVSVQSGKEFASPSPASSLAALGGASALVRKSSYRPSDDQRSDEPPALTQNSEREDMLRNSGLILDNPPTVVEAKDEDDDSDSDMFESVGGEDYASNDMSDPEVSNNTTLSPNDEGDVPSINGLMV